MPKWYLKYLANVEKIDIKNKQLIAGRSEQSLTTEPIPTSGNELSKYIVSILFELVKNYDKDFKSNPVSKVVDEYPFRRTDKRTELFRTL